METVNNCVRVRVVRTTNQQLPAYETELSAGMDVRAELDRPIVLDPGTRDLIPTGLYMEIPAGYEVQVRPRSGLAYKRGLTVLNAPGTIDADYRGELGVLLVNTSSEAQTIEPGERIAQLLISPVYRIEWLEVDELGKTDRGGGGFGSTGVD
ncbi:MAG: dUTP diphosphatase [Candidatus Latescibacterota bacterium]|nr:dUTP diphosphatase [Candidatus Latescibacterota bacterium]